MSNKEQSTACQSPIGVFDSGMGGLTVLKQLNEMLPNESFIYLGDTARLPYGTKSQKTVIEYAKQMVQHLLAYHIKLLVIACNTATIAALAALRQTYPNLPIVGVLEPGAKAAIDATDNGDEILVLATETTIRLDGYQKEIQAHKPDRKISSQICGLFVALAEEGFVNNEIARVTVKHYLDAKLTEATRCILLGCTHYPVLKKLIADYVGHQINIVDSAIETAKVVKQVLIDMGLASNDQNKVTESFVVTDLPERFARVGAIFLGRSIEQAPIELVHP